MVSSAELLSETDSVSGSDLSVLDELFDEYYFDNGSWNQDSQAIFNLSEDTLYNELGENQESSFGWADVALVTLFCCIIAGTIVSSLLSFFVAIITLFVHAKNIH